MRKRSNKLTHNASNQQDIVIYKTPDGSIAVDVQLHDETIWLSLNQITDLFERDKSVISRHLQNIFKEQELNKDSVVANFATTARDQKIYQVEYYNLDAIISVGYRVTSKRGTQFRQWASKILKDYLIKGYSLNQKQLSINSIIHLQRTVELLSQTLMNQSLVNDLGAQVLQIIKEYSNTWDTLLRFDENSFDAATPLKRARTTTLEYKEASRAINSLKSALSFKGRATALFGQEHNDALKGILGNLAQTFLGKPLYSTSLARAAHLLYFIIKDHPFSDGNKRIGCLLFLLYLKKSGLNLQNSITDHHLTALALLIAESHPSQKDVLIQLIIHMLKKLNNS